MIPASTLKLLTSLAALRTLGPSYRFHTLAAYDAKTHRLFIKGFGYLFFISYYIKRLGDEIIACFHPKQISEIIIDTSFFSPDITIPGIGNSNNPYDATTGALCANFNTFHFKWLQRSNAFISAEPQTPFFNVFNKAIRDSGLREGRILLSRSLREIYPGLLLAHFLKEKQLRVTGKVINGPFNSDGLPVMKFESAFSLDQAVEKLLAFSNNFMANQIMLAMGAGTFGSPATLEKGVKVLRTFAITQLSFLDIKIEEGSGLSRKNRITPSQMLSVLMAFKPYYRLLRQDKNDFYKTGTLSDVRSRAGYLLGEDQELYPYVIMRNHTRIGVEGILKNLKQKVRRASAKKG